MHSRGPAPRHRGTLRELGPENLHAAARGDEDPAAGFRGSLYDSAALKQGSSPPEEARYGEGKKGCKKLK